ncbi:LOG family protein [Enemella sp. A6]|uniref:LOG family protein n=1 Tax=Enemella sp. A6 TaxID=3440152 RepID=UPI003EBC432A
MPFTRHNRRTVEIESLEEFDAHIERTDSLAGWFIQSVDLTERRPALDRVQVGGAVFLGCAMDESTEASLRARGALIFPRLDGLPFDPYRSTLYDADELFGTDGDGLDYAASPDAQIYAWTREHTHPTNVADTLAMALHDHAITDALDDWELESRRVVGVMGGHAMERGTAQYADAARLGLRLSAAGKTVLTGGGPGAMEAANLGAWFANHPDLLDRALTELASVPSFRPDIGAWAAVALRVRAWVSDPVPTIGIPTWFYGHEPPNVFPTGIAKYFANAIREDTLLNRARGGIVYLPGAAGTTQEIFQAVTGNYYAADAGLIAPLVLVGRDQWTQVLPAWQLLESLAEGRAMAEHIHLVDTVDEALAVLLPDAG